MPGFRTWMMFVVVGFLLTPAESAVIPSSAELTCRSATIRVGEPLIIKVSYKWPEPFISEHTGEVKRHIEHATYMNVNRADQEGKVFEYKLLSTTLDLEGTEGMEYSGYFPILYRRSQLVFPEPGDYVVRTQGWTVWSDPLMIKVLPPTELEERALSLLRDRSDYGFLILGVCEYPKGREERMSEFGAIADECGEIPLGKWVAARAGIEYFNDFLKKRKPGGKPDLKSLRVETDDPVFAKACKYLATAYGLADEHPFREEVVAQLCSTELMKGNYEKALSLVDELGAKYPQGEFGGRAPELRGELERQIGLESQQPEGADDTRPALWGRSLIIPALAVAGVAVIGVVLALVLRKRAAGKTASKTQG